MSDNDNTTQSLTRVLVERHPNPEVTSIHVNVPLTSGEYDRFRLEKDGTVKLESYMDDEREAESFVLELVRAIYAVPGVTSGVSNDISVSKYEFRFSKAMAFTDTEVETGVLTALVAAFDTKIEQVDVRYDIKRRCGVFDSAQDLSEDDD